MNQELICPNCKQPVEAGAEFCGNCGQPVAAQQPVAPTAVSIPVNQVSLTTPAPTPAAAVTPTVTPTQPPAPSVVPEPVPITPAPIASPVAQVYQSAPPANAAPQPNFSGGPMAAATPQANPAAQVPNYAVAYPHPKQHRAAIALAVGIIGMAAGLLIAIAGIALGIIGIVLSTTSYKASSKGLRISSLIVSILAVLIGVAVWVNAIAHDPALHPQTVGQAGTTNGKAALNVTTPCYKVGFDSQLNVNNAKGSCTMNAYNGSTLVDSSNVYKVLANTVPGLDQTNFASLTKQAIESDVSKNLSGFSVTNESSTTFSGDTAYYVQASDASEDVAVIEEGVLHDSSSAKDNFFVMVHATNGSAADLSSLEKSWQWND